MRGFALLLVLLTTLVSQANTIVRFTLPTDYGSWDVELFDDDRPITVTNFLSYVERGEYTNMFMHRWEPGFVLQGGGYGVTNRQGTTPAFYAIPSHGNIAFEHTTGPQHSNLYGTIAMARSTALNSASSQFYFNLANNTSLDTANGGYTVFGRTISGTALSRFVRYDPVNGPWIGDGDPQGTVFDTLPLQNPPQVATFDDLMYCKVEILKRHQRITFPTIGPRTFGDPLIPLVAGSNVGLPVTFEVVSGPAFISDGKLALSGAGTVVVKASNAGNASYSAASATQTIEVAKASQEITFSEIQDQLLSFGSVPLTYSAPARLPVTLTVMEGPVIVSNRAAYFTNGLGKVTLKASQPGTVNYHPAPDVFRSFHIRGTVTLSASAGGSVAKTPDQASYTNQSAITLKATAQPGYEFVKWSGDVTGTASELQVLLTSNLTAHAEFRQASLTPPRLTIVDYQNSRLSLRLQGAPASNWEVQRSATLTNWVTLKSGTTESGDIIVVDEAAPARAAFYRAIQTRP